MKTINMLSALTAAFLLAACGKEEPTTVVNNHYYSAASLTDFGSLNQKAASQGAPAPAAQPAPVATPAPTTNTGNKSFSLLTINNGEKAKPAPATPAAPAQLAPEEIEAELELTAEDKETLAKIQRRRELEADPNNIAAPVPNVVSFPGGKGGIPLAPGMKMASPAPRVASNNAPVAHNCHAVAAQAPAATGSCCSQPQQVAHAHAHVPAPAPAYMTKVPFTVQLPSRNYPGSYGIVSCEVSVPMNASPYEVMSAIQKQRSVIAYRGDMVEDYATRAEPHFVQSPGQGQMLQAGYQQPQQQPYYQQTPRHLLRYPDNMPGVVTPGRPRY